MLRNAVLGLLILSNSASAYISPAITTYIAGQNERDEIWRKWHLCIKWMNFHLDQAEKEAEQITNIDVKKATLGAIKVGICSMSTKSLYAVAIGAVLGAVSEIAGDSYTHYIDSRSQLNEAKVYALMADDLQEQLWRLDS